MIFGSSFAFSKSSQDNFTGTTSHVFPPGFDHGECRFDRVRIDAPSFILSRQEKVNHLKSVLASKKHLSDTKVTVLEQEKGDYHSYSEILVGNKNMDKCSTYGKSVIPYFRKKNDSSLLVNDPSTSNKHSPAFCEEQYQIMKNYPAISLFPSCSSLPKLTKLEMLHHGSCCLHIKPSSAHNVKTTRICTSVEEVGGSPPRISQTTHSLLNAKKTDVNLCKENQIFRVSRVLAQVKKKSSSEFHSFDQLCGHGQQGVKLQLLGRRSSADGEGKGINVQDVNALEVVPKNESSAETDTMDMDKFKENHLSGVNSSPKEKDGMAGTYLPPYDAVASAREVRRKRPVPGLPDINIELPALPAAASSIDNAVPSTSRTQSLDMDLLLHAEQPSNAKSNNCQDSHLGPESSSRRIKRLKLGSSGSLNLGEASHEKVTKFFSKIMKTEIMNLEPTSPKCTGKELMVLRQKTASVRNGDSSSVDNMDKGDNITLSHFWIQRWRRNKVATPQKKPEAVVVCEPQSSKVTLEDSQKKQCPSIAAMALMGKAMNGFQPCEFQNRGSFIVWNTKGL